MSTTDQGARSDSLLALPLPPRAILIATDLGHSSLRAAQHGVEIARRYGSRLHFLNVVSSIGYTLCGCDVIRQATDLAKRDMDDFRTRLICSGALKGIEAHFSVRQGDVGDQVTQLAHDECVDLIVVGSEGHGRVSRWVFGSASEVIRRRAQCPVLTVNVNNRRPRLNLGSVEHVLFPMDFRESSDLALACAASIATKFKATLSLIHVVNSLRPDRSQIVRAEALMHVALERLYAAAPTGTFEVIHLVECGNVSERILEVADSLCPNLIVMPQPKPQGLFTSSTASRIVDAVHCPVLTPVHKTDAQIWAQP